MKNLTSLLLLSIVFFACSKKNDPSPPDPVPSIINFTPDSGIAGTQVTITGTNFSSSGAENMVQFNGITAAVTNTTSVQLKVNVPVGATSGKITIKVNGETVTSTNDFTVFTGSWLQKADFGGSGRVRAVGFSIGSKGYIVTGYTPSTRIDEVDFWEFDTLTNKWTRKADFPGGGREFNVGFSIGDKGYIGLGYSLKSPNPNGEYKDFWEYDPIGDEWTRKPDVPFVEREAAVGFSIGNKGYVGLGTNNSYQNNYKDFWEYDPATNNWKEKTDFPGTTSFLANGFSIIDKGYVGLGASFPAGVCKQFWQYDPSADSWVQKSDFGGDARTDAAGFSIGNKGYMGFGYTNKATADFWQYNPSTDQWVKEADFTGVPRYDLVGFNIGNKGYVGTGNEGGFKDFWQFTP